MKLTRRNFLKRGSTALVAAGGTAVLGADEKPVAPPVVNPDAKSRTACIFAYGYQKEPYPLPAGPHLFMDCRYVQCGRVAWQTPDGNDAPLFADREIVGVRGKPRGVPFGIRLVGQKAKRIGPVIPNDREWEFMIGGYNSLHALGREVRTLLRGRPTRGRRERESPRTQVMNRRAIGRAETTDIRQWVIPETVLWSQAQEDPTEDYYDNSKSLYPGTRTMHLMFPTIYHRRNDDCSLRMASSLDGAVRQTIPGGDVLRCGHPGSWDAGCLFGSYGLTEIPDERVVLPYGGFHLPHKYPRFGRMGQVGLAGWIQERLVAEAVTSANETCYGLAAYAFSESTPRLDRLAARLQFGHVACNTGTGPTPEAPFGGFKRSGFGREGGLDGLFEFCESQVVARA